MRVGSTIFGVRSTAVPNHSSPAALGQQSEPLTSATDNKAAKTADGSLSPESASDCQVRDNTKSLSDGVERIDINIDKSK